MSGGGTDPFSNTTTRNLLQHIISPKVVSDGASGYAVKTDLINIDNAYVNNNLYVDTLTVQDNNVTSADKMVLRTNGGQSYITTTTNTGVRSQLILTNSGTEIKNQDNGGNGTLLLQTDTSGNGYVRAGYSGGGTETLYLGTQNLNSVTIAPSGNVSITGTITASNLKRYTQTGVTWTGAPPTNRYSFSSALFPVNSPAVYTFLIYSSNGGMLQGVIIVGLNSNGTAVGNYYNTTTAPSYSLSSIGANFFLREDTDLTTDITYPITSASIIIQQIA